MIIRIVKKMMKRIREDVVVVALIVVVDVILVVDVIVVVDVFVVDVIVVDVVVVVGRHSSVDRDV